MDFDNLTQEYVDELNKEYYPSYLVYLEMKELYDIILSSPTLKESIKKGITFPTPSADDVDIQQKVMLIIIIDLIKCFHNMGHDIDLSNKDSVILIIATSLGLKTKTVLDSGAAFQLYREHLSYWYNGIINAADTVVKHDQMDLLFLRMPINNNDITKRYLDFIITASRYIKESQPINTSMEKMWIDNIYNRLTEMHN